ncbi:unnamed protein product, partial [marine sediment metagenome]
EKKTTVRLGTRSAQVSLKKRRREAWQKLKEVLTQLEGKDILVSYCGGARSHFWTDDLLLRRLQVERGWFPQKEGVPRVVVLWSGVRVKGMQQQIRVFLDQLSNMRTNDYGNYVHYLIDFWNGWGEYPLDQYRPQGSVSLVLSLGRKK